MTHVQIIIASLSSLAIFQLKNLQGEKIVIAEIGESQLSSFDYWHFIVQSIFLKRGPMKAFFPFSILHFMSQVSFVEKSFRLVPRKSLKSLGMKNR